MSDDLKPCPFCGGDKSIICRTDYDGGDAYAVSCRYSDCHGHIFTLGHGYFSTKEEAIAAWNTRADADRIEELERERDGYLAERNKFKLYLQRTHADLELEAAAVEALTAKLAKAMEALRFYAPQTAGGITFLGGDDEGKRAAAVLAELEGGE
jgi:Lar family restriction alleviation protein